MRIKDYEPLMLGGFYQSDIETLCCVIDYSSHPYAESFKYKLQNKINVAIMNGEWV